MRLGDCDALRNVICWSRNSNSFLVFTENYSEALQCQRSPTVNDLLMMTLLRGYYWKAAKWSICQHQAIIHCVSGSSVSFLYPRILCRVYDNYDGFFFVNCSTRRRIICEFDQNVNHPEYVECIKGNYLSTNPAQSPTLQVSISTTITQRSTEKNTSTFKPSTSIQPFFVTTTKRQTHKVHETLTDRTGVTRGTGDVNGVTPTPISHAHETQEEKKYQQAENDLRMKIGVPVTSWVVLFGVFIIVVYIYRRYKCDGGATKRDDNVGGQLHTMSNTNQLQPSNVMTVSTETNSANDDSVEDEYASIDELDNGESDRDMNTQSYERSGHYNAFDDEYLHSRCSDRHDQGEDGQYNNITDLKRQQNKASDNRNKAIYRYDVHESEPYMNVSSATTQKHKSSDDNGYINVKRSNSVDVKDTTRPERPVNGTTDNIYNLLDERDKGDTYDELRINKH
ncbi:hypothetical protein ACF0H5_009489 [Mactra antiquata]